ncbi:DUF3237 domain-containing protein [Sphingobium boeckii]|uniref:UPF0311 protein FHS49_002007 n=1 Tax=Sphingobium boeckii TaxID=1082345 RepID=A0A7W9AIA2_9SPHN|nr:DUF3237 domain-containing protein [Sphingobium boeckii]MBB5685991.1 hypothetical protein [Sphingobium boeckii]
MFLALLLAAAPPEAVAQPDPYLEFAFEALVTLSDRVVTGKSARGGRGYTPITGGSFHGPSIRGEVLPGGWDWQLERTDGCREIKADYMLKTDDGTIINILNTGTICPNADGRPTLARTQPVFEAPIGKYDWLSKGGFVGTLEPGQAPDGGRAVRLRFFRVR